MNIICIIWYLLSETNLFVMIILANFELNYLSQSSQFGWF